LKARMCSMDTPERLYGYVFGGCRVAHDFHDPGINGALVKAKERFESVYVTPPELIEDVALSVPHRRSPFYLLLLPMQHKGYMHWLSVRRLRARLQRATERGRLTARRE
jgi:hypothetical protein